jgi:hypothetical protein
MTELAENKTYNYSTDEENFFGSYDSRESAAEVAFNDNPDVDEVLIGENVKRTAHHFVGAHRILEGICEDAYDEIGECSEDWLSETIKDKEACAELEKIIGDWIEARDPVKFFVVENTQSVLRPDNRETT